MKTRKNIALVLIVIMFLQPTLPQALSAPPLLEAIKQHFGERQGHPPATAKDQAIEELAANIDWLEHELGAWGTVVPKTPDVWGEARLTQFRHEVEEQLAKQVDEFVPGQFAAAQIVSDQAFLAAALSMKLQPTLPTGVERVPLSAATAIVNGNSASVPAGDEKTAPSASVTINGGTVASLFGSTVEKFTLGGDIKLEQTESLDQLRAYLDHLNELRRTNEGDDTSDAPGYSLSLVRIPISILPGTHSRKGYGAEVTITAVPQVGPELLPFAYRDFVINDLVDQLAVPFTRYVNDSPVKGRGLLNDFVESERHNRELHIRRSELVEIAGSFVCNDTTLPVCDLFEKSKSRLYRVGECGGQLDVEAIETLSALDLADELDKLIGDYEQEMSAYANSTAFAEIQSETPPNAKQENFAVPPFRSQMAPALQSTVDSMSSTGDGDRARVQGWLKMKLKETEDLTLNSSDSDRLAPADLERATATLITLENIVARIRVLAVDIRQIAENIDSLDLIDASYIPTSQGRRSTLPFPSTHLQQVFGLYGLAHMATTASQAFERDVINRHVIHISDVQSLMRAELAAAYDLLALDVMQPAWMSESTGERMLYSAVRRGDADTIAALRDQFLAYVGPQAEHFHTAYFAWAVFVESILLNERLLEDMQQTVTPYGGTMAPPCWMAFFGPQPSGEARAMFAEYVKVRWPVKVFAVDPVVLEQNIADVSNVYREMQLAIALSVAGGEMSTSAALNTLRKIQRDMATIDLNRTVVGFGHGNDTFGWRFYPRFQTPPVESNITVFFRDLVIGGPTDDQLECSKQIEPGMRECVALVLMPSFVPGIQFDSRGNWFRLTHPGHTAQSISENVEYSRSIEAMRNNAMYCTECAHLYRPGELSRLLRRVDQLDRALPLQTLACQLPIENSLGGFEIFSSGTRELAPELLGWYGAPGYDSNNGSTFFLAGDNFSIHQTSVIAGNRPLPIQQMLSRQVVQVTLPPGLPILSHRELQTMDESEFGGYVDVHVGTPYGVSGHLLIPAITTSTTPAASLQFENGFLRYKGKIKITPDSANATQRTYAVENLQLESRGPVVVRIPRLKYAATSVQLKANLLQQTPQGAEPITHGEITLTGLIDNHNATLTVMPEDLTPLSTELQKILTEIVGSETPSKLRIMYIMTGAAAVTPHFSSNEPIAGGIPIDIVLEAQ